MGSAREQSQPYLIQRRVQNCKEHRDDRHAEEARFDIVLERVDIGIHANVIHHEEDEDQERYARRSVRSVHVRLLA